MGQRQLICIARAVLADPRILILDEATANIDTVTEVLIQEALERLLAGRTAMIIAHRLSTIRSADLICVVEDGRIVEQGKHDELLERGGLYKTLHEKQFKTSAAKRVEQAGSPCPTRAVRQSNCVNNLSTIHQDFCACLRPIMELKDRQTGLCK